MWAAEFGRDKIIEILLKAPKIDVSAIDLNTDDTALILAEKNGHNKIIELIQEHSKSFSTTYMNEHSPLRTTHQKSFSTSK